MYPYDHSRVPLATVPATDYINASLVSVEAVDRSYILTQGPLAATTPHFWSMVWEQGCRAIIMLNRVIEKSTPKCHQYWPADTDTEVMKACFGKTEGRFNDTCNRWSIARRWEKRARFPSSQRIVVLRI